MPIILAHGQPKSGSTFVFQAARRAAVHRMGLSEAALRARLAAMLGETWQDYHQTVTVTLVDRLLTHLGPNETVCVKTHGPLDPDLSGAIARGWVVAFTSVRDVRDTALSMVDAGRRDATRGASRTYFQAMESPSHHRTIAAQRSAVLGLADYLANPFVLTVPHEAMAADQSRVVHRLLAHVGHRGYAEEVVRHFAVRQGRITEFHKGTPLRFATEMGEEEIAILNRALADEIAFVDRAILAAMRRFDLVSRYLALRAKHRRVLAL